VTSFEYSTPSTTKEAVALLSQDGARVIAGGTDLLIHMRAGIASPKHLVDLTGLGLSYIRQERDVVKIGATTTFEELLESEIVRRALPCLREAAGEVGAVQTRNMASIGGNLCSAVPSADSAPPLLVYDALVKIAGRKGDRLVALEQFFAGPKKNILKADEILVEIQVPLPSPRTGAHFLKKGRRNAMSLAVANVATLLSPGKDEQRTIEKARIALGAVAPVPLRARKAEALLQGAVVSDALIDQAATAAADETAPITDLRATAAYRRDVSRVLVKRALERAWEMANART
jgi:CO/xanthine dehydrogenase FAD-binding subunit